MKQGTQSRSFELLEPLEHRKAAAGRGNRAGRRVAVGCERSRGAGLGIHRGRPYTSGRPFPVLEAPEQDPPDRQLEIIVMITARPGDHRDGGGTPRLRPALGRCRRHSAVGGST